MTGMHSSDRTSRDARLSARLRLLIYAIGGLIFLTSVLWLLAPNRDEWNGFTAGAAAAFALVFIVPASLVLGARLREGKRPDPISVALQEVEGAMLRRANWPRGRARILSVTDLHERESDWIKARIELEVAAESFRTPSYRVSIETLVPPLGAARLAPGALVNVLIATDNRAGVEILWNELQAE